MVDNQIKRGNGKGTASLTRVFHFLPKTVKVSAIARRWESSAEPFAGDGSGWEDSHETIIEPVTRLGSRWRAVLVVAALCSAAVATSVPLAVDAAAGAAGSARHAATATASSPCTSSTCTFPLSVNPGLRAGATFACPAIQHATGSISVTNRFATDAQNDVMTLTASGLPPNTGFDLFLIQAHHWTPTSPVSGSGGISPT